MARIARLFRRKGPQGSAWASWRLDCKLGLRMLIKHPGLTLVGGFGIAVAVAISAGGFSILQGTFLVSALPFEEGDRIVSIEVWDAAGGKPERRILRDYQVWREELGSIQELGAFRNLTMNLTAPGAAPVGVRVAAISAAGFQVTRVPPLLGRRLVEDDERAGSPEVAVISESVWRNRFGSDPGILGRTIQLGATAYSIAGVMPEGFAFPVNHHFWIPLRLGSTPVEPLTGPELMVFGRLSPGATLESAQAELETIGRRTALRHPNAYAQLRPRALPYPYPFVNLHDGEEASGLSMMNAFVTLPLVVVCLNVAILVYTRTATRQVEIGIRTALGAGRGRIVAQLFVEALALSVVGAAGGVALAAGALALIQTATAHIAADLPFWVSFQLSPQGVLYSAALSVLAAAIVGILPGLQATGKQVHSGLRITGAGGAALHLGRVWTALIVAQVGFAVALLPASVSNTWESARLGLAGPGFDADQYLSVELGMDASQSGAAGGAVFNRRFGVRQEELLRRLRAEPQVSAVTFSASIPGDERGASIEGDKEASASSGREVRFNRVDTAFFRAFHIPVLAGRGFQPGDVAAAGASQDSAVVVVNQTLARRLFGGDALGRRIRYLEANREAGARGVEPGRWREIVGIVPDFPTGVSPAMQDSPLKVYHPAAPGGLHPVMLSVRVRDGRPATFSQRLAEIAAAVDPDFHLRLVRTLEEALRGEQWIDQVQAGVLGALSVSVLLLSSTGIYALMSFTVSQRRKEIGIRTALGADGKRVLAGVFSRALAQLGVGAALGVASALLLEKIAPGSLMKGSAAMVIASVALLMMAVGFLAALAPARRCLRMEPTEALREQ